ncbi:MAG TPA: hypothetical protein VIT92_05880 [Burkholderiaceae bacterium]
MEIGERLKLYVTFADVSRRWTTVMDTKAAFLSAMNGALLAFLWRSAGIAEWAAVERLFGGAATLVSLLALMCALWTIAPREKLSALFGKRDGWYSPQTPVGFYGYIARNYGAGEFQRLEADMASMADTDFAREALEEHFAISHVMQNKSEWVFRAAVFTFGAVALTTISLLIKLGKG